MEFVLGCIKRGILKFRFILLSLWDLAIRETVGRRRPLLPTRSAGCDPIEWCERVFTDDDPSAAKVRAEPGVVPK